MSKHVAPSSALSPKVKAGALVAGGLIVLQFVLAAVTPDMFAWAGDYSALFYAAVTGLGAVVAAYLKRDTLRDVGSAAVVAGEIPDTSFPSPDDVPSEGSVGAADELRARVQAVKGGV